MKRSLTRNQTIPHNSTVISHSVMDKESNQPKSNSNDAARRASATMLGIAAISMGATAGIFLPTQGEEVLAVEPASASLPLTSTPNTNSEPELIKISNFGQNQEVSNPETSSDAIDASQGTANESNLSDSLPVGQTLEASQQDPTETELSESTPNRETQASQVQNTQAVESTELPEVVTSSTEESAASETEASEPQVVTPSSSITFSQPVEAEVRSGEQPQTASVEEPNQAVEAQVAEQKEESVVIPPQALNENRRNFVVSRAVVSGAVYQVQQGDTLETIANQYGVTVQDLMESNGLNNPNRIQVNQELKIPRSAAVRARVNQSPAVIYNGAEDEESAPVLLTQANEQALVNQASDRTVDPFVARLKEDVMRMRQEFREQNHAEDQAPQTENTTVRASSPQTANPEWVRARSNNNTRQQSQNTAFKPTVPVEDNRTEARTLSPSNRTASNRTQSQPSEPRVVAAAPAPSQSYNRLLNLPSGQTVEPQIPPLPGGEQFLPERPQEFNGYIWPARGTFTSGYGPRWGRMHKGIDIAAPTGTPIYAAASGVVESAGWNSGGYGNLVKIRHPDGSVTLYAHNSKVLVRKDQRVEQGQQISLMGSTGYSTGPHLHFEIHPPGQGAVNPMAFLPKNRN